MKLRNKNTGEIGELHYNLEKEYCFTIVTEDPADMMIYKTISAILYDWEDYVPKEPLIKDEKIRKAVRAWAEMNDIRFIHMCSRIRKENARVVGQNALGRSFTMEISNEYEIRIRFKDYKMCYTVAELCGEEEE